MKAFLNTVLNSALAIAVAGTLAIPLVFTSPAEAACYNSYRPTAFTYVQKYANGTMLIQVDMNDFDSSVDNRVLLYANGGALIANVGGPNTFLSVVVPNGLYKVALANFNSCRAITDYNTFYYVQ